MVILFLHSPKLTAFILANTKIYSNHLPCNNLHGGYISKKQNRSPLWVTSSNVSRISSDVHGFSEMPTNLNQPQPSHLQGVAELQDLAAFHWINRNLLFKAAEEIKLQNGKMARKHCLFSNILSRSKGQKREKYHSRIVYSFFFQSVDSKS